MKRISYPVLACTFALAAAGLIVGNASATPVPTGVVFQTRIFNDCNNTILTTASTYPASVSINEVKSLLPAPCGGFANLHAWKLSNNGFSPIQFQNTDIFSFEADLVISGSDEAEAGLMVAPWFATHDGRFNVRSSDGEIACFGGVLPFYSFTGSQGLHYVKGQLIHLSVLYRPRDNAPPNYGQITYSLVLGGTPYTSGPLNMDGCNTSEQPIYGCYGILNFAEVGGFMQHFLQTGPPTGSVNATWSNIVFSTAPTAASRSTWGAIKTLYR
jgi:hypothetical protein